MSAGHRLPPVEVATEAYEAWLRRQVSVVERDLARKHRKIAKDPFAFLRGTFYRWVETWSVVCREHAKAPLVAAVGDLHIENFGTWRDLEGRLVWGVNDFDESAYLPYTNDLIRLAVSTVLAIDTQHLSLSPRTALSAILDGYREGLDRKGRPFVLEGDHPALRRWALIALKDPGDFWETIAEGDRVRPRLTGAKKALEALLPPPVSQYEIRERVAGMGSLGRPRYVALAMVGGAPLAREAKARVPSAAVYLGVAKPTAGPHPPDHAVRIADPYFQVRRRWIVRRLSPECTKLDLDTAPRAGDQTRLPHAMGWETANIHLGSRRAAELLRDLDRRGQAWLRRAADDMAAQTLDDWKRWRRHERARGDLLTQS